MTIRPSASTPALTGEPCQPPSRRGVSRITRWRWRRNSTRPARSTAVFVAMDRAMICTIVCAAMATVFTKIINGELPGRFVWSDERAVGFLSINPLGPGHTLVVPRAEVDQWVDADAELLTHLTAVSRTIGDAIRM